MANPTTTNVDLAAQITELHALVAKGKESRPPTKKEMEAEIASMSPAEFQGMLGALAAGASDYKEGSFVRLSKDEAEALNPQTYWGKYGSYLIAGGCVLAGVGVGVTGTMLLGGMYASEEQSLEDAPGLQVATGGR
jgi:hypothetical protein